MRSRPIHAVMITPSASGGHARYTWELMTALRTAAPPSDLTLTLLTSRDLDPEFRTPAYEIADVLSPLRLQFSNRAHWAVNRVVHYARREEAILHWLRGRPGVDVVHYQEPPFGSPWHLRRVRAIGPVPLATVHNVRPHDYPVPALRSLSDFTDRAGWRLCAALFVHSPGLQEELTRELGPGSPPVVAIPHGVWTGHGGVAAASCPDGYLLLFGVMRRNKGLHVLLDALAQLPGMRLVLAGSFPEPAFAREIRHRVATEGLAVDVQDRVVPEQEIGALFAGASLAVLPYTDFHAQSGVLHLAIAYGTPVAVTDVGALGEPVRRDGIGVVAPPGDPAALARSIRAALEPATWAAAREHSLALARKLSWSTAARLTLDAYVRVCSAPARGEINA